LTISQVFTIKSDHGLRKADYDRIDEWAKNTLPEANRLKENFYVAKSMMKPLGLGYQNIDTCPNFYFLYYSENVNFNECRTCGHSQYKPKTSRGKTFVIYRNLRYFPIIFRLQKLFISLKIVKHMTWYHSHNMVDGVMVYHFSGEAGSNLIECILSFQWNHEMYILGYVQWIQSIWVIFYILFLLDDDTHGSQLSTRDVYETKVHVLIYSHTWS
jgi:hypothetical protein